MKSLSLVILLIPLLLLNFPSPATGQSVWQSHSSLQPDIDFWVAVFAKYYSNQYLLHDNENLKIIYKIVTFDSSIQNYQKEKQLEQIKEEIEKALVNISRSLDDSSRYSHLESYIRHQFGPRVSAEELDKATKRIRAQQGMKDRFLEGMPFALAYLPYIKDVFRQQGLPEELAYLPHIESSFNPSARSRAGAAGLWQFMQSTGRLYMKVNNIIDERYDPLMSTQAAARLLHYNYKQIGDWGLAITAYNFGLAGIKKAVVKHGPDYMKVRESFTHRKFRFASRNFYPEFLAVVEIMKNYQQYFPDIVPLELPAVVRYQLKKPVVFTELCRRLNLDNEDLRKINPAYTSRTVKGKATIPAGYWVNLPADVDLALLEHQAGEAGQSAGGKGATPAKKAKAGTAAVTSSTGPSPAREPMVAESRHPALIYRKPGVVPDALSHNYPEGKWGEFFTRSDDHHRLIIDEFDRDAISKFSARNETIIVFANETIGHYADWLKLPVIRLQQLNNMGGKKTIYQGQKLRLDFSRVSVKEFYQKRYQYHMDILNSFINQKEFVNFIEYQVSTGESVWDLARNRYRVPVEIIQYFNLSTDLNRIFPGDIIRIPIIQRQILLEETL